MPSERIGGRELHYEDSGGDGIPLVLLHGFPLRGALWDPQVEALGGRFRIIVPDLPGFGRSEGPEEPERWRVGAYAEVVVELLDRLEIEEAVVGGLSMGGYVAFSLLRRYPTRVLGLVLADTQPGADSIEARRTREAQQEQVRAEGIAALRETLYQRLLAPKNLGDPMLREKVLGLMEHPPAAYLAALEAMKHRPDSTPELSRIQAPTLIVVGEDDVITPPAIAKAMERSIPGARLVVLEGAGHLSNLEEPAAFNEALATFLGEF